MRDRGDDAEAEANKKRRSACLVRTAVGEKHPNAFWTVLHQPRARDLKHEGLGVPYATQGIIPPWTDTLRVLDIKNIVTPRKGAVGKISSRASEKRVGSGLE